MLADRPAGAADDLAAAPPGAAPPSRPFWLLALLIGSGTIGMHVFVPALPLISDEFGVDAGQAQLTISLYMVVIALGQLVYGPLSDRLGRRPVLIGALVLFTLSGIGAALASSFNALLLARLLQAAGGCAGLVLGRAVVHDTTRDQDAASTIAAVNAVLLISPLLSPILGIWLAETLGWRSVPVLLAVLGAITVLGVWGALSETAETRGESFRRIGARYLRLIGDRAFRWQVLAGSLTTTTMFTLLTSTPFVVIEVLKRPLSQAAWFYAVFIAALIVGNVSSSRVLRRLGWRRAFILCSLTGTVGGAILTLSALGGTLGAGSFLAGGVLYTLMAGTMAPLALTRAVGMAGPLRGSAAGLFGSSQFAFGALCVMVAGASADIALMSGLVMWLCAGSAALIFWWRRD